MFDIVYFISILEILMLGWLDWGILDCFYQSNKNGVMGSRWSPERMCAVDFSIATSRTQCLTPLGVLQVPAVCTDYSFLLPDCCSVRLLLHRHHLQEEMVNLPPLSCKNTLSFWGAGKAHHPDTLSMQPQLFCCVFVVSSFSERSIPKVCNAGHGTVCFLILLMDCDLCPWL